MSTSSHATRAHACGAPLEPPAIALACSRACLLPAPRTRCPLLAIPRRRRRLAHRAEREQGHAAHGLPRYPPPRVHQISAHTGAELWGRE